MPTSSEVARVKNAAIREAFVRREREIRLRERKVDMYRSFENVAR